MHSFKTRFVSRGCAVDLLPGRCCRVRNTVSSEIDGKSYTAWFGEEEHLVAFLGHFPDFYAKQALKV